MALFKIQLVIMSDFWMYFNIGLRHVLDIKAYGHVLFLIGLTIPYTFKDWKRVLLLITIFTIGFMLSLMFVVFGLVVMRLSLISWLILITILVIALFNLFTAGKSSKKESISIIAFITLFFGIIHGLSYSGYFNTITSGSSANKILPLFEFALGVEAAQILVVFIVLVVSFIIQTVFRFSKRDWVLVMSAFVIGVVLPKIIESKIW